jgi:hypothetical protein
MIEKIVDYISKNLWFGEEDDPDDVNIKYLASEEKKPYWYISRDEGNYVFNVNEIAELNNKVKIEGGELTIVVKGFYIDTVEKEIRGKMYCQKCKVYREDVIMSKDGNYCVECRYGEI